MSIDWLYEIERGIDNGKVIFATQGAGRNQWVIGKPLEELRKVAQRAASHKKMPVDIVRVVSRHDAITGDQFLVPTQIGDSGPRGEPTVQWTVVDTKDAAEMMRDVRQGPSPFFGLQVEESVEYEGSEGL